jgi:hypothetical protein
MIWDDAMQWVKTLDIGGYRDWRLPTKDELKVLAQRGGYRPAEWFNANGFSAVQNDWYWSSSTDASYTVYALIVYMNNGDVNPGNKGSSNGYVWPVRAGQ